MIDFVGKKRWFFLISAIVIILGIVSLAIFGLRPGVDFSGGTAMTLQFNSPVEQSQLRQELADLGHDEATAQKAGDSSFIIRLREIPRGEADELVEKLGGRLGRQVEITDYYLASPTVGVETTRNAGIAVIIAAVAMLFYIVWAFRRMPSPFRWGTCAIIALIHDVLIVIGIFSILGQMADVEVSAMFITGLLAVVGYSINNTVVVFDRIRENMSKGISPDFAVTVNLSLIETLGRSLNASLTTLCVILALFLFGGATIHHFILVLLIGLLAGTYSSLFIAGPLLVVWEKKEWGELMPFVKRTA